MKNYEQMAEVVLRRAEACVLLQKRNRRIAATATAFGSLCLLIAVSITVMSTGMMRDNPSLEQPPSLMGSQATENWDSTGGDATEHQPTDTATEGDSSQEMGIILLAAYTMEEEGTLLTEDLALPLNYSLRIRDLRGLSEDERAQAIMEERKLCDEKMNQSISGTSVKHGKCTPRENYVLSFVRNGCFRLRIEDYSLVESIGIQSATNYGKIDVSLSNFSFPKGQVVTLTPEEIPEADQERGLVINWGYSNAVLEALDDDPAIPLKDFSDTVVFTVNYTDGTVRKCEVKIQILDDGQIFASLQGGVTAA